MIVATWGVWVLAVLAVVGAGYLVALGWGPWIALRWRRYKAGR